jgi:hypothetical protein
MSICIIWKKKTILEALTATGLNFEQLTSRGLQEKNAVATWDLGSISAFAGRQRKNKKPLIKMAGRRSFRMYTDL